MKQGASAAKPPPAAAPKEGAAPFTSRPYRGARGNSQGRQSIGGGPPATAAPASGSAASTAAVTGPLPPQAARPERFSGAGKEEEMMGSRIRAVST